MSAPARRMITILIMVIMLIMAIMFKYQVIIPSGPASVDATSDTRKELADRIQFLESYVTFKRKYESLDYDIKYRNNSGLVPGPSDWDIRLIAAVPRAEIEKWIPDGVEKSDDIAPDWVQNLPGTTDRVGITEWYKKGGITIGVDRERSIVAYRATTMPD